MTSRAVVAVDTDAQRLADARQAEHSCHHDVILKKR